MMLIQSYRSLLVIFAITGSFGRQVPDNPPHRPDEVASNGAESNSPEQNPVVSVAKRQTSATNTNNIKLCFDCDGPCQTAIATTGYKTVSGYFNAIIAQLTTIYKNSQLPLTVQLWNLNVTTADFVLDPFGNFSNLQSSMDLYWKGARWNARRSIGCHLAFFVTTDPMFAKSGMPAGMSYINSLCSADWGFAISKWDATIAVEAARIAHEISHTMNINHIPDKSAITYTSDIEVQIQCNPDRCDDPTGSCITQGVLQTNQPPTFLSLCGRAIFFAWKASSASTSCIGGPLKYYDVASG